MALALQDSATAELHGKDADAGDMAAAEDRVSSASESSSSSSSSSEREDAHHPAAGSPTRPSDAAAAPPPTQLLDRDLSLDGCGDPERIPAAVFERDAPPPTQLMDRDLSFDGCANSEPIPTSVFERDAPPPTQLMDRDLSLDGCAADPERIPAAVFERDPSESNKDWSMMSTESVFGLQVAPSSDFTGFFLTHPELMDIATPPRASTVDAAEPAMAAPAPVLSPPFDSIPELPESTMKGSYSFAFPNLIEDKRNCSKKAQQEEQPPEAEAPTEAAMAAPTPVEAEARAEAQPERSSNPDAAPKPEAGTGGLFSFFPCC